MKITYVQYIVSKLNIVIIKLIIHNVFEQGALIQQN